jgi:hypothetical protein
VVERARAVAEKARIRLAFVILPSHEQLDPESVDPSVRATERIPWPRGCPKRTLRGPPARWALEAVYAFCGCQVASPPTRGMRRRGVRPRAGPSGCSDFAPGDASWILRHPSLRSDRSRLQNSFARSGCSRPRKPQALEPLSHGRANRTFSAVDVELLVEKARLLRPRSPIL